MWTRRGGGRPVHTSVTLPTVISHTPSCSKVTLTSCDLEYHIVVCMYVSHITMRALMEGLLSCPHSAAKLRELHLDNVGVLDSSAQALAQLVACNLQLRVLSLNDNKIGDWCPVSRQGTPYVRAAAVTPERQPVCAS